VGGSRFNAGANSQFNENLSTQVDSARYT